jgi:hypothetical protein
MTPYVKRLRLINLPPEERWACVATAFAYPESLVELAVNRLTHGDVVTTKYGTRVALRRDLGDDRSVSGATAYWPSRGGCRCRAKTSRGVCSHEVAAQLYRSYHTHLDRILERINLEPAR